MLGMCPSCQDTGGKENLLCSDNYCYVLEATWLERQNLPFLIQVSHSSPMLEVTTAKTLLQTSLQIYKAGSTVQYQKLDKVFLGGTHLKCPLLDMKNKIIDVYCAKIP